MSPSSSEETVGDGDRADREGSNGEVVEEVAPLAEPLAPDQGLISNLHDSVNPATAAPEGTNEDISGNEDEDYYVENCKLVSRDHSIDYEKDSDSSRDDGNASEGLQSHETHTGATPSFSENKESIIFDQEKPTLSPDLLEQGAEH